MSLENPYCSVAQVQSEIRNTDSALTTLLEDSINQISRFIDEWKGRDFYQHDHSSTPLELDKYDTDKIVRDTVFLPFTPIILLTSVTVAGVLWVLNTDYIARANGTDARLISLRGCWFDGPGSWALGPTDKISIIGKFGYAQSSSAVVPTGIPSHISKAAIIGAAALSAHNQKEVVGMDGVKSAIFDKNFPKSFWDLLGPRRPIV